MHGFWTDPDVWKSIVGTVGNVLAGVALLVVRRWMRNSDRDREEHKKEVDAKIASALPADVHSRGAAAGQGNGLDRTDAGDPPDSGFGRRGRLRD